MLKIVGLGPGPAGLITADAKQAVTSCPAVFIQTEQLPQAAAIAAWDIECISMDELYEKAEDYAGLDGAIAERLLESATRQDTAYCVYGSGLEGQRAAALAMEHALQKGVETLLVPGVSAAATAAACAGQAEGYAVHFGLPDMLRLDTGTANVFCDMDRQLKAAELKLRLLELYPEDLGITMVSFGAETPLVTRLQLQELDRRGAYPPFSYVVLPPSPMGERRRYNMADLDEICHVLRAPGGCPWDREQTHGTLRRNMLEEAHEAIAAIDEGDMEHFCDELGDVLLQVALHGEIAREHGEFSHLDITSGICEKMIRRHPHVFSDVEVSGTAEVLHNWEEIKKGENGNEAQIFGDKYRGLPGLMQAQKLQKAAAKFGFDWPGPEGARDKLLEEMDELMQALQEGEARTEMEAGDVLFAAVNMARLAGADSETAMLGCCRRFSRRIGKMEEYCRQQGKGLDEYDLDGLNALWDRAKSEE